MSLLGRWFRNPESEALRAEVKALRQQVNSLNNIDLIKAALTGKVVGYWSSDHFQESMNYEGWVYAAINPILNQVGQATVEPGELNERDNDLYDVIHKPNPEQRLKKFNRARALQLLLTGIAIEWQVPNKDVDGSMVARYIIPTGIVAPTRQGYRITLSSLQGITWSEYPTQLYSILNEIIPYEQCTTLRFEHPLILGDGLSPVWAAGDWIDLSNAIDTSRTNLMQRGMRPNSKVTEEEGANFTVEDRTRLKSELKAVMSSPANSGETLWIPKGLALELYMLTSVELDHVNGFTQMRDAIFGIYGVPPIAAGVMEATSNSEFYAAMLQLTELRVQPLLDDFAEADVTTLEKYNYTLPEEFKYKAKRVDDPDQRHAKSKNMSETGGYTYDEIRAVQGYPPLEIKGVTDVPLKPGGAGVAGETPDPSMQDGTVDENGTGIRNPADKRPVNSNGKQ